MGIKVVTTTHLLDKYDSLHKHKVICRTIGQHIGDEGIPTNLKILQNHPGHILRLNNIDMQFLKISIGRYSKLINI
jgi:hypothetical protein